MRYTSLGLHLWFVMALGCGSPLTVGSAGSGGRDAGSAGGSRTVNDTGGVASSGPGTGATGNTSCALDNACSTPDAICVHETIQCTCQNGVWNPCRVIANTGGTGSSGGGPSTGDGGSGGAGGVPCITVDNAAKLSPQVLFFVIDATGSMRDIPASGSTNGQRKWDVLKTVWPELIDNLPNTWAVGMMEWACPGCPSSAYSPSTLVPIAALDATQRDVLKNGLTFDVMGGYTPTECAYSYALEQVRDWQPPPAFVEASRFIVLLTDGVPTVTGDCQTLGAIRAGSIPLNDTQYGSLIATVAQGTIDSKISTFIGGVPGSDEPQGANYDPMYMLSLLAAAGGMPLPDCTPASGTILCPDGTVPQINALGTAYCDQHGGNPVLTSRGTYCHYDLTQGDFAEGLRQALKTIKTTVVSCAYSVPEPPPPYVMVNATTVQVIYKQGGTTDVPLTFAANNDCAQGGQWHYSEQDPSTLLPTKLELCSEACNMVQADLEAAINIRFECVGEV